MSQKRRKQIRSRQPEWSLNLEVVHPNAAGIDIGNESHRSPAVVPLPQSRTHPPQSQLPAPRPAPSPSPSQQPIQREAHPTPPTSSSQSSDHYLRSNLRWVKPLARSCAFVRISSFYGTPSGDGEEESPVQPSNVSSRGFSATTRLAGFLTPAEEGELSIYKTP